MKTVTDTHKCSHLSPDSLKIQGYTHVCYAATPLKNIAVFYKYEKQPLLFFLRLRKAHADWLSPHQFQHSTIQRGNTQATGTCRQTVRQTVCKSLAPRRR